MMALDRSPESFSPQMNSTFSITIVQTCDPRGGTSFDPRSFIWIELIKVHKAMLHTKNQSSRPSRFREEEFWTLPSLFLWPNLWPQGGANLDPRGIISTNLVEVNKEMLHTKYQSSMPSILREEEFWRRASLFQCSNLWTRRFLKVFFFRLPWQPEIFTEFKSLKYSESASPKDHFCEVSLKSGGRFQKRRFFK